MKAETVFVTHKQFDGELFRIERQNMKAHGRTLSGASMDKSGLIIEVQDDRNGMIVVKNWRAELRKRNLVPEAAAPILDPTAPIPANEIENADEPHDDIGTGVDPEPANNLPDVQPAEASTTPIICPLCGDTSSISTAILSNDPIKCPVCGKYSARWQWEDDRSEALSQPVEPTLLDHDDTPLRVNDWVKTLMPHYGMHVNVGERGAIVGLKNGKAVIAFPFFKTLGGEPVIAYYLPVDLRKIEPPEPTPDPVNDANDYVGVADAALAALEQADIERAEKTDPYAWATPERHTEVQPISEKLLPLVLRPTKEDGVWLIEDATTEKTMRRGLNKFGVTILSVEEGESVDEFLSGEPYTIARFSLGKAIDTPFPSKRTTKPAADPNSIHAQYDALHDTLPAATFLLIQANGDEWLAFQMDAMLLRRYAPLCRFSPQTINQAGEQWDKLSIPAGMLDETVTNANEGGLTVALASIVRDEPGKLPVREVDEIHAPNEPVQYVGKEDPPTDWETEADADDEPLVEAAPIAAPKIEMTPALMAAKIKLHIHGALRLGLIESVTPMPHDGWFAVTFVHGLTEAFTVPALKTVYEVGDVWRSKRTVYVREQSTTPHGTAIEQAAAVLENLSSIGEVFADAKARMEAFTAPEPTTVLLDHDAGADLIATLRTEHADLSEAALGITEFLLNVIARMRTVEAARVY